MSIYNEICNLKNSFDALLQYVQIGGTVDADVWGKLSEMKPVLSKLRDVHIRQEAAKGKPNSELAEMWGLCPPRVERITKTRPQPNQKPLPNKRVMYMGAEITVPRGARWLAYNVDGIVLAFTKEPVATDVWESDAIYAQIHRVDSLVDEELNDWASSLRKIAHLEEIR